MADAAAAFFPIRHDKSAADKGVFIESFGIAHADFIGKVPTMRRSMIVVTDGPAAFIELTFALPDLEIIRSASTTIPSNLGLKDLIDDRGLRSFPSPAI